MAKKELKKSIKDLENKIKNYDIDAVTKDYMNWLKKSYADARNSASKRLIFLKATLSVYKKELEVK